MLRARSNMRANMRSRWHQVAAAHAEGQLRTDSDRRRDRRRTLPRGVDAGARSALYTMLSPSSDTRAAAVWARLQTVCCVVSILTYAASTVPGTTSVSWRNLLVLAEGASSACLGLDYVFRLATCREHRHYAELGPLEARLRWITSPVTLLSLVSCYPVLSDSVASVTDLLVMLPRIALLLGTSKWRSAVRTARRVLFVNREILSTSVALVSLTIVLSAVLLYATCTTEERCREENGIVDLPSATYAAAMMLTGQASPEGGKGLIAFRAVVMLTAFLSVPFFAVPAAMLTWGFEGEAARLAVNEKRRASRGEAYADGSAWMSSSSSDSDKYDDYLESLGGGDEDEEATEAAGAKALAFFVKHANEANDLSPASSAAAASAVRRAWPGSAPESDAPPNAPALLFPAQQLARTLARRRRAGVRTKMLRRDALDLLRKTSDEFSEGLSADEADRLEQRLRAFARVTIDDESGALADEEDAADAAADVDSRLSELKREVGVLRRTTVAAMGDLKQAVAEVRELTQQLAQRMPD